MIFTLWHGELLPLLWHHRAQDIAVVISEHRDGEIIARIAESLGYATVRGSTSRGGGRALIGLMRALEEGRDGAVTPDGPRGPAHVFAPGAAIAAQRTGAPLVPIRAARVAGVAAEELGPIRRSQSRSRACSVTYGELTPVDRGIAARGRRAAARLPG